jgi:hypothetical protein
MLERALQLARSEVSDDTAIAGLEESCGGHRVAAVRARQELAERDGADETIGRAIRLLDGLLARLPV